jgi:methyltransferase-like protein 6
MSSSSSLSSIEYSTESLLSSSELSFVNSRLSSQGEPEKPFWVTKYEVNNGVNWDKFYKRNENRFFKDRHYLDQEFGELREEVDKAIKQQLEKRFIFFEIGCGVGNSLFPLVELFPQLDFLGCDVSQNAISVLKKHQNYKQRNSQEFKHENLSVPWTNSPLSPFLLAFQHDLVHDPWPINLIILDKALVDFASLIFVLSALSPSSHLSVLKKIHNILTPGALLFIRDYGLFDAAQLRFSKGSKLDENFYVRQDGTRAYFFSVEKLQSLLEQAGFQVFQCVYCKKIVENRKEQKVMNRIFIQVKARATSKVEKKEEQIQGNSVSDMKTQNHCNEEEAKYSETEKIDTGTEKKMRIN